MLALRLASGSFMASLIMMLASRIIFGVRGLP
jgi:hypothetical protein